MLVFPCHRMLTSYPAATAQPERSLSDPSHRGAPRNVAEEKRAEQKEQVKQAHELHEKTNVPLYQALMTAIIVRKLLDMLSVAHPQGCRTSSWRLPLPLIATWYASA